MLLEEILLSDDIDSYRDELIKIIPELEHCIGFDQKHPHHHLDVWEHTMLALSMAPKEFDIRLALLLHDIGKPFSYQQDGEVYHYVGHADKSAEIAKEILKRFDYPNMFKNKIIYLIRMHDTEITKDEIRDNYELCYKRFIVQKCDALAHNPSKLDKRKQYILKTRQMFRV